MSTGQQNHNILVTVFLLKLLLKFTFGVTGQQNHNILVTVYLLKLLLTFTFGVTGQQNSHSSSLSRCSYAERPYNVLIQIQIQIQKISKTLRVITDEKL